MEREANRLIGETSPYLLQHAHNPVDWFPWGEEALRRAGEEDRPILLSVGYAACHWCHVMERESFEDSLTARYMNENFVCVKVDREERPDIDAVYMDAVQAMTGRGGWPMTVFLTPDGVPFYGGTYFPPDDRPGMPSFRRVMEAVLTAWRERREEVHRQGRAMVEQIRQATAPRPSGQPLAEELIPGAIRKMEPLFDGEYGGFGGAPKFPQPPAVELLVRSARRGIRGAREMAELTLRRMALGGIYDQLGGGFHRYAVDRVWLVPHFEKMLYDNAQLARVYTHAWQAWRDPLWRRIALETCEYLLRDMRHPKGGFFSSEDADSEGVEGRFYAWSHGELAEVASEAVGYYGVTPRGNFEGANVLTAAFPEPPARARARLLEVRSRRVRPGRDEKVLASWNGLAIGALAEAGAAFGREDLVDAARGCAAFVLESMVEGDRLLHSWRDGRAKVLGMLEDYAYLAEGLFTLWEATFEPQWAAASERLCRQMIDLFGDPADGGLFATGADHEQLIVRQKEIAESVTPAPGAIGALVLQRLAVLTGDAGLARRALDVLSLASLFMERAPQAVPSFLCALDFQLSTPVEVVVVGDRSNERTRALLAEVWGRFLPNRVLAGAPPGIDSPMLEGKQPLDGAPTAFVCESYACRAPTTDPADLARQLG